MILQFLFAGAVCAISAVRSGAPFLARAKDGQLLQLPLISIIEDDESVRVATQRFVRSLGFAACAFASAEEFLQSPLCLPKIISGRNGPSALVHKPPTRAFTSRHLTGRSPFPSVDSVWTPLLAGLSPPGMAASLAQWCCWLCRRRIIL